MLMITGNERFRKLNIFLLILLPSIAIAQHSSDSLVRKFFIILTEINQVKEL
jgi:hypothetical protein